MSEGFLGGSIPLSPSFADLQQHLEHLKEVIFFLVVAKRSVYEMVFFFERMC